MCIRDRPYIDLRLDGVTATITNSQFYHQGSGAMIALGRGPANATTISLSLIHIFANWACARWACCMAGRYRSWRRRSSGWCAAC